MNPKDLIAMGVHAHADVSCWNLFDEYSKEYDRAADAYFRSSNRRTSRPCRHRLDCAGRHAWSGVQPPPAMHKTLSRRGH